VRPGEPQRAYEEEERQEHPEQPGPDLALQQRDRRDREQDQKRHRQAGQRRAAAGPAVEGRDVREAGRGDADQQQRGDPGRDEDRVDRDPARAGPVHVAQVQDQRELVEDQRGPRAEQRGEPGPPAEQVRRGGDPGHPARDHEHHAEHHVVQVRVAAGDVARPPADLGPDEPDRQADEAEADQERDKEAEQRKPAGMHDLGREPAGHAAATGHAALLGPCPETCSAPGPAKLRAPVGPAPRRAAG